MPVSVPSKSVQLSEALVSEKAITEMDGIWLGFRLTLAPSLLTMEGVLGP